MLVAFKNNQMHEDTQHMQTNFNDFHALVRAKIEHLFARVRKWEFFAHSRYTAEVTDVSVMAVYRIHAALMVMHHTDEKMPTRVSPQPLEGLCSVLHCIGFEKTLHAANLSKS
jgi:hypothetical protein